MFLPDAGLGGMSRENWLANHREKEKEQEGVNARDAD
jgi:hypothetical protein